MSEQVTLIDSSKFSSFGPCIVLLISKQLKRRIDNAKSIRYNVRHTLEVLREIGKFYCEM